MATSWWSGRLEPTTDLRRRFGTSGARRLNCPADGVPKREARKPNGGPVVKYLLLLIPCVVAVATPLYNSVEPRLFGFPMFYWFILLMIPVTCLCMWLAYIIERGGSDQ
jgi:hypothetical protein